jgi:hypothetical protein
MQITIALLLLMALMIWRGRVAATAPETKKLSPTTTMTTGLQRATAFSQRPSLTPLVLLAAFHAKKMSKRVRAARRLPRGACDSEVWLRRLGQRAAAARAVESARILRRKKRQGRGG